jgi:hypothetical protein
MKNFIFALVAIWSVSASAHQPECPYDAAKVKTAVKAELTSYLHSLALPFKWNTKSVSIRCMQRANPNGTTCYASFAAADGTKFSVGSTGWDGYYVVIPAFIQQVRTSIDNEGNDVSTGGPIKCASAMDHLMITNQKTGNVIDYGKSDVDQDNDPQSYSYNK